MVQTLSHIDLSKNEHVAVFGVTQHGKTFSIIVSAKKLNQAVIFFNPQHVDAPGYVEFNVRTHSRDQLIHLLKNKRKVNFVPSTDRKKMQKELTWLVDLLYSEDLERMKVKCLMDEVHLFKGESLDSLVRLATTGLRWGKECVFISQRGAMMDNNLITQSTRFVFFKLGDADYKYFDSQGWPIEKFRSLTKEKYIFCEYDQLSVKGSYKIKV